MFTDVNILAFSLKYRLRQKLFGVFWALKRASFVLLIQSYGWLVTIERGKQCFPLTDNSSTLARHEHLPVVPDFVCTSLCRKKTITPDFALHLRGTNWQQIQCLSWSWWYLERRRENIILEKTFGNNSNLRARQSNTGARHFFLWRTLISKFRFSEKNGLPYANLEGTGYRHRSTINSMLITSKEYGYSDGGF